MQNETEITGERLTQIGQFTVQLSSAGNPDHNEDPDRPVPGVPSGKASVKSIAEASLYCQKYIEVHGLGGGNWTGGEVTKDGAVVARISYNGRAWEEVPSEKPAAPVTRQRER